MNKTQLDAYKASYLQTKASDEQVNQSWRQVKHRLPKQERNAYLNVVRPAFTWVASIAIFFVGFIGIVQAAKPGEPLYPVKILQENIVSKALGKPEVGQGKKEKTTIEESLSSPDAFKDVPAQDIQVTDQPIKNEKEEEKKVDPNFIKQQQVNDTKKTQEEVQGAATIDKENTKAEKQKEQQGSKDNQKEKQDKNNSQNQKKNK